MVEALLLFCLVQDGEYTDERILQLIDQLAGDYEDERVQARKELEKVGTRGEKHFVDALRRDDHRIRKACLELLTTMKSEKAVESAAAIFRAAEEEKTVRQAALDYLRATGRLAEEPLIEALDSPEGRWRLEALETLTEIKSEKCAEKVAALYNREGDKAIKDKAFECLQKIGKPAQPFLLKLLDSPDPLVRRGALIGLTNIGATSEELFAPVSKLFLAETSPETLEQAFEFLKKAGTKAEPVFLEGLKSAQEVVRLRSIDGLGQLMSEAALGPIAQVFANDASDPVREQCWQLLVKYGPRAEDAFVAALSSASAKVRLKAIEGLGDIKSEKPYEKIAELFRADKDPVVHEKAFQYLRKIGIRAERELLLALKDEDLSIVQDAIAALGAARSEAAIEPLVDLVGHIRPEIRGKAVDALVRLGAKAMAAVNAAVAAGRLKRKAGEEIQALFVQQEVEDILDRYVTSEGGTGYYEGQFAEFDKYGREKAVPVLLRIVANPDHPFRDREWKGSNDDYHKKSLRELAIMAVGVLGDKGAVPVLKKSIEGRTFSFDDNEYVEVVIALARLGEKGFLDALVLQATKDAQKELAEVDKERGYACLFKLALAYNRVGERSAALDTYMDLVRKIEEHKQQQQQGRKHYSLSLYNMACLHALKGEKDKAVECLGRAVDAGFKDREWILMDRDLDAIRAEEEYKKLMGDAKRFEKPAPD